MNVLAQKAVLVGVNIRRWTGRRLDKKVTDEVNEERGAAADAGRYNKLLIDKKAFADINSARSAARNAHYTLTMPWMDNGSRILPATLYDDFAKRFRQLKSAFDLSADNFAKDYPRYVKEREKALGKMFNAEDYPHPSKVRGMFGFSTYVLPCPDGKDFRVSLSQEAIKDIRSDFEEQFKASLEEAMKEPYRRIVEVVERMAEKLKAYNPKKKEGVFRDSLVDNIRDLVKILPSFNLTDNKKLGDMINRIDKELCVQDADTLREDDTVRKAVAKSAEAILEQANALMA